MVIEKQRGESEKISEILPLKDYFKENEKNLKNSTKLSERVKSKISHLRILANDKNSFYRAIGFAYLEDLFLENLNVKKEKLFQDLKIYKLINQLELECKLEKFIDAKSRKQDILGKFIFLILSEFNDNFAIILFNTFLKFKKILFIQIIFSKLK